MTDEGRVPANVAAHHINVSATKFAALINEGVIDRQDRANGYDLAEVRLAYIKHLRAIAGGQGAGAGLAHERSALARSQRESIDIRNAQLRGDLVSVKAVAAIVERDYTIVRERLLSIPGKLADELTMRSRAEIEPIIRSEIAEALNELHDPDRTDYRGDGSQVGDAQGALDPQAATDVDAGRVGGSVPVRRARKVGKSGPVAH